MDNETEKNGRIGKTRRVIGDILIVLVAAFMLYLGAIMHQRIQTVVFSDLYKKVLLNEQLLCLVLLVFALDVRFALLVRSRHAILKVLGWVLRVIVIAAAALLLVLVGRVVITGATAGAGTSDNVIVLGMALEDGQPTKDLLYRIETAQDYGEEHPEAVLILTGGNPDAQGRTEAAVMRDILVENGFPEDRIVLEDRASNTEQNFVNTAQLIDPAEPVMLVSSNYHMGRAVKTAESAGFTRVIRLPAPSAAVPYGANVMWEVMMEITGFFRRFTSADAGGAGAGSPEPGGEAPGSDAAQTAAAGIPVETVRTDAFTMDCFRFGTGEDTLVILPGLSVQSVMGSADAVAEAYQLLADEYTIYLFDRRNELPSVYSVYDMARDTAEAFRALGLENVCLFGASQGGMIAMDIAIEDPELVQKLILGSTSACVTDEQYGPLEEWIRLAEDGDAEGLYLALGEGLYPEDIFEQSRELLVEAAKTVTEEELERFVIVAEGTKGFDVSDDLEKIACPVLVIGSMDDEVLGADASEQIAERLNGRSDFELYMYDGYGHAAYDTAPDYKERMLRFLSEDGETGLTDGAALAAIRESGVLRVGTTGDYKPMSFLDPETGEYWGFDTALTEELADALGVEIEYVPTTWPTLMEDTLAGKFDLAICGITITDARQEQALMSDGYLVNGKTVLCRAEDADVYTSLEAINRPEVRVMENPGGLNEKFARENLPDAELIIHDVNEEIPGLVAAGEADVMITEVMEAGYYVGQDDRLAAPLIYKPFTQGELGVLMPKGSEDLLDFVNDFLAKETESGRIDELAEEYIYRYITADLDQAA